MGSKSQQPAARMGDVDTGHPGAGPTPIITASSNVKVNDKGSARLGDKLKKHHKGTRVIVEGANSVLINGKPAVRVTDAINCGGVITVGSGNVFIGDSPKSMKAKSINLQKILFSSQKVKTLAASRPPVEQKEEPEYKDLIVRLDIDPNSDPSAQDQFILTSTDGSYKAIKTVVNDMIPGDNYLDLEYTQLDTSKNYKLVQRDPATGESSSLFESTSYDGLAGISPQSENDIAGESSNDNK